MRNMNLEPSGPDRFPERPDTGLDVSINFLGRDPGHPGELAR